MYRYPRISGRFITLALLATALAAAIACGSGITHSRSELGTGPTPKLPVWATQDRLISVNLWADKVILGADGVQFAVTQVGGSPDSLFQIWYEVEGQTKEIPFHVLIRTGDFYVDTVQFSQTFDSDGYLENGKWFFPSAVSVVGLFDDTVIELYE